MIFSIINWIFELIKAFSLKSFLMSYLFVPDISAYWSKSMPYCLRLAEKFSISLSMAFSTMASGTSKSARSATLLKTAFLISLLVLSSNSASKFFLRSALYSSTVSNSEISLIKSSSISGYSIS